MDRFVVREARVGADYPQGNQMIAFSANAGGNTMVPETIYLSGPFAPEYTAVPRVNQMNVPNMAHNINPQMAQMQAYGHNNLATQGHVSGIDSRYLAGYTDSNAQFIVGDSRRVEVVQKPNQITFDNKKPQEKVAPQEATTNVMMPLMKKPNQLDQSNNDVIQNLIVSRADKLKALHKTGPRAFSGPIEKVLKWHKSLQDIGLLIFYEIVAKCVSIRPGELCSKNLVVRDESGPAMQVVYYEVDFMLPELKPPCTVRVIGRMLSGTSRLQAFSVRAATGDDVSTLPRRAAVAAHHVAKLCKEFGHNQPA